MAGFKCKCGSKDFILTEITETIISIRINTDNGNEDAEFDSSFLSKKYILTCTKCGNTYINFENEKVKNTLFGETIFYDLNVLEKFKQKKQED